MLMKYKCDLGRLNPVLAVPPTVDMLHHLLLLRHSLVLLLLKTWTLKTLSSLKYQISLDTPDLRVITYVRTTKATVV